MQQFRGRSYLSDDIDTVPHEAAPLLRKWKDEGIPVLTSEEPWSLQTKDERLARGCHLSAQENSDFLREEFAEFIESGYWVVLPCRLVRQLENLKLSPAAVKAERVRKPCLLCDHSWHPINETAVSRAPQESMQFGGTLARILRSVRRAIPHHGLTRPSKHDIKDGHCRMFLRAQTFWH